MYRILLACLLTPLVGLCQLAQRNLLQRDCSLPELTRNLLTHQAFHPFPISPEQWNQILADSVKIRLIKNAEAVWMEKFESIPATTTLDFTRNGNRTRYETILFGKRDRLWKMVLAESIEGSGRFMDAILNGIWSIAEESFWGTPAHLFLQKKGPGLPDVNDPSVDLFAAETAATLAFADYFLRARLDSVSPLIRKRIYSEVNRRVFVPLEKAQYDWMGGGDKNAKLNNWVPWIFSNFLTASLMIEQDQRKRVRHVALATKYTDQYINGFGNDGACEEGPGYWSFGPGCTFDILSLLKISTNGRIDIFDHPLVRAMGAYIYKVHIAGYYFVNVGDSSPEIYPEPVMVWRFGQAVHDRQLSGFGKWLLEKTNFNNAVNPTFHRARALMDWLGLAQASKENAVYVPSNSVWLDDVQLMTARLKNGMFVAAHGGHNGESHNHNDVGDFIIYAGGEPVIIDVGKGTYTSRTFSKDRYKLWFNTSAYHNLPAVNGQQQQEGKNHAARNVRYSSTGNTASLVLNIERAFPVETKLKYWKRGVHSYAGGVDIIDSFSIAEKSMLTHSLLTVCEVQFDDEGYVRFKTGQGRVVELNYGNFWKLNIETIPLQSEEERGLQFTWKGGTIRRLLFTYTGDETKGVSEFKFSHVQ